MEKVKLSRFVSKYNLAGLVESVKWESKDNLLTAGFISDDKSVLDFIPVYKCCKCNRKFSDFGTYIGGGIEGNYYKSSCDRFFVMVCCITRKQRDIIIVR